MTALLRLILWAIAVGASAGVVFGLALALREGWLYREIMDARQWRDALTYSAAAHAVAWAIGCGLGASTIGLLTILSRRIVTGIRPASMAVALWVAGVVTVTTWMIGSGGPPQDPFPKLVWWAFRFGVWLLIVLGVYLPLHLIAGTVLGRVGRKVAKGAIPPAVVVLVGCVAVQWLERPRLVTSTPSLAAPALPDKPSSSKPPNVIFIVLDTQRLDRIGCYGCDRLTTPCLDAIAADALVFDRCYSAGVWTLPSHASMFTGLYPSEHGANYGHMWLDDRFNTMAELLVRMGYDTAAFSNNAWIGTGSNLSQGFDQVVWPTAINRVRGNLIHKLLDDVLYPAGLVGPWIGAAAAQDEGAKHTNQFVDRWLTQRSSDRPFFLFVNYLEPHSPYRPPLPHRRAFVPEPDLAASYRNGWVWNDVFRFSLMGHDTLSERQLRLFNDTYDGEVRLLDGYVGDLFERLGRHVTLDDCLVVITSDHGENIGDHHLMTHYWCVYDTLAHVPLIVRYPRRLGTGRCGALVQTTDLLPTVLHAACGRRVATQSSFGRSLFDVVASAGSVATSRSTEATGATTTSSKPASETGPTSASDDEPVAVIELMKPEGFGVDVIKLLIDPDFDAAPLTGVFRAIRRGPWKLIRGPQGICELYNLDDDPTETDNVAGDHPAVVERLTARLQQWLDASRPYHSGAAPHGQDALDNETRRRLQGLGYIQ